ncbi:hypothetical protein YB2330_003824 [Saitoella coloradoensis]
MKVVALISGGKDSCFNMMHCVANGHEIVALANLRPPAAGPDELDSWMYQTVGHDAIHLYSECMNLPLYRGDIIGSSLQQGLNYTETEKDETEDLYKLLSDVKAHHPDVQAVSVGAILSSYQRIRVEHVCARLGLVSLAYLWQREQKELLAEMVNNDLTAILIKVAAIGLKRVHLGKTLGQMQPLLLSLNERFDLHPCGEGGEYETFVLDCPLFSRRIVIDEQEIVDHSAGDVAYLKLIAHTEAKDDVSSDWLEDFALPELVSDDLHHVQEVIEKEGEQTLETSFAGLALALSPDADSLLGEASSDAKNLLSIYGVTAFASESTSTFATVQDEMEACMSHVKDRLSQSNLTFQDVTFTTVILASMSDFVAVNEIYKKSFQFADPPSRVCISAHLPLPQRVQVSVVASTTKASRKGLHVQGQSYWAPANIGPYSQCINSNGNIYIAGQIGMIPATLQLPEPRSVGKEALVSLQSLLRICDVVELQRQHIGSCIAYVIKHDDASLVNRAWHAFFDGQGSVPPTLIVQVESLPKGALVEWQVAGWDRKVEEANVDDDSDDDEPMEVVQHVTPRSSVQELNGMLVSVQEKRVGKILHSIVAVLPSTGAKASVVDACAALAKKITASSSSCIGCTVFYNHGDMVADDGQSARRSFTASLGAADLPIHFIAASSVIDGRTGKDVIMAIVMHRAV